jgi:N utilization substance protein A
MVVNELRGEKIDVVQWTEDPARFVANALAPAKVKEVRVEQTAGVAQVIVPDYQLSLAIGKEGQNARLAAKLTGLRVDIRSETQASDEERARPEPPAEAGAPTAAPADPGPSEPAQAETAAAEPSEPQGQAADVPEATVAVESPESA